MAHTHLVGDEGHVHAFHVEMVGDDAVHLVEEVPVELAERLDGFRVVWRGFVFAGV